jgi:phosphate-selective porin OprO/OprP
MLDGLWTRFRRWVTIGSAAALCAAATARAEEPTRGEIDELKARLEALEKQNQQLQETLQNRGTNAALEADPKDPPADDAKIKAAVDAALKARADADKKAADEKKNREKCEGYEVGTDVGTLRVFWNFANGVNIASPHNDFILHVGGRFQFDSVWWGRETPGMLASTGKFEDGVFFRRIRLNLDGIAWDNVEFNLEYAFENFGGPMSSASAFPAANVNGQQVFNKNPAIGQLDEFWVGLLDMPWIGSVRIGHLKVPQGLEGDMVSSSKDMSFLERASYTDAFYENFAPGIWFGNHILCDRATWAFCAYRQEGGAIRQGGSIEAGTTNGAVIGDDAWGYTARFTCLPIYENEGRCLVHLGASATYRDALPNTIAAPITSNKFVDFSARPEMRDTIGGYQNVGPGNSAALVDTGLIQCNANTVLGGEALAIWGPFAFMAEGALSYADDAVVLGRKFNALGFWGGYLQATYILTGENWLYDRRLGRIATNHVRPYSPWFFKRDRSGCGLCHSIGALELAVRYSYLNLNDFPVQGGILGSSSVGVNWYLNTNLKIQFEFLNSNRWGIPNASPTLQTGIAGGQAANGPINSFGIRTQILF